MKKYIIHCLIAFQFIFVMQSNAQQQSNEIQSEIKQRQNEHAKLRRKSTDETVAQAEFVFEGIILKDDLYYRNGSIRSQIIKITNVFKGKLKRGTVEVLSRSKLSFLEKDTNKRFSTKEFKHDTVRIFICNRNARFPFDSKYNIDLVDNQTILYCNQDLVIWLDYFNGDGKSKGVDSVFENKQSVYNYLRSFPGMKLPKFKEYYSFKTNNTIDNNEYKVDTLIKPKLMIEVQATQYYIDSIQTVMRKPLLDSLKRVDSIFNAKRMEKELRRHIMKMKSDSLIKVLDSLNQNKLKHNSKLKSGLKSGTEEYLELIYNNQLYGAGSSINYSWNGEDEIKIQFLITDPKANCGDGSISSIDYSVIRPVIRTSSSILNYIRTDIGAGDYEFVFKINDISQLGQDEIFLDMEYYYNTSSSEEICNISNKDKINTSFFLNISVENPVTFVKLNKTNIVIDPNNKVTSQIEASVDSYASIKTVNWSYDDGSVASVSPIGFLWGQNYGIVYGYNEGTTTITATADDKTNGSISATCTVTVLPLNIQNVSLSPPTNLNNSYYLLNKNYTCQLIITPFNASISSITWSASPDITINSNTGEFYFNKFPDVDAWIEVKVKDKNNNIIVRDLFVNIKKIIPQITKVSVSGDGAAGIGNILTIEGYGFGLEPQVDFTSADDNSGLFLDEDACDYYSYNYNSNTNYGVLKMFLPSIVSINGRTRDIIFKTIGSGSIDVYSMVNDYKHSNTYPISINRCFTQYPDIDRVYYYVNEKYRTSIKDYISTPIALNNGVAFKLDASVTDPAIINVIKRALSDWSCALSMNITIDENSNNTISIDNVPDEDKIMVSSSTFEISDNQVYYKKYNIIINKNLISTFDYSLPGIPINHNKRDFYNIFLHEVGHVLGLEHINKQTDLMYWDDSFDEARDGLKVCTNTLSAASFMRDYSKAQSTLTIPSVTYCIPPKPVLSVISKALSPWGIQIQLNKNSSLTDTYDPPSYVIERSLDDKIYTPVNTVPATYLYDDVGLNADTKYYYRIKAINSMGESTWIYTNATTQKETIPPTPSSSSSSYNYGAPAIYWQDNTIQTLGYLVLRSNSYNGTYTQIATVTANISNYVDYTASSDKTYFYMIVAYNNTYYSAPTSPMVVFQTACNNRSIINLDIFDPSKHNQYATNTAYVKYKIPANEDAIVEAGSLVHISNGFSATKGSYFHASISQCSGYDNNLKSGIDSLNFTKNSYLKTGKDSILQIITSSNITIYPNPTKGQITVEASGESFRFELYDMLGILLKNGTSQNAKSQIDISNYVAGSYYLKIVTNDNIQKAVTILKE